MTDEQTIQIPKLDEAGKLPVTYLPDSVGDAATAAEVVLPARDAAVAASAAAVDAAARAEAVGDTNDTIMAGNVGTGGAFDTKLLKANAQVTAEQIGDHATAVAAAIAKARALGISRVVIPEGTWEFDSTVEVFSNMEIDASAATILTTTLAPGFLISDGTTDVQITVGRMEYATARPSYAEQAGKLTEFVGVQVLGERTVIRGTFARFRAAVRVGRAGSALATSNDINIHFDECDFGIVVFGQTRGSFYASGRYSASAGSPDFPHAIYHTDYAAAVSEANRYGAEAFDSTDGEVVKIRRHGTLTCDYIRGRNVPGLLQDMDSGAAVHSYKQVTGEGLTLVGIGDQTVEGIRLWSGAPGPRVFGEVNITVAATVPVSRLRVISETAGGMDVQALTIRYSTSGTDSSQSLVRITTGPTRIGAATLTNLGAGAGVTGIYYASGTGHVLDGQPVMSGMLTGVYVHSDVTGAALNVDKTRIGASFAPVTYTPKPGVSVNGAARTCRTGWWYNVRPSVPTLPVTISGGSATAGRQYWYPALDIDEPMTISELAVKVTTAQAGTIAVGIVTDSGDDAPRKLLGAVSLDTSTTGMKSAVLASPIKLTPGRYWVTFLIKADTAPAFLGVSRSAVGARAVSADSALEGAVLRTASDVASLADGTGSVSDGTYTFGTGVPLVAYRTI